MNKLLIFCCILLALASCAKDDDNQKENANQPDTMQQDASPADVSSPSDAMQAMPPIETEPMVSDMSDTMSDENSHLLQLQAIVNSPTRERFLARNVYRNPMETLQFFKVKPTDTIVELWPGGGWYTSILAPYTQGKGQLYLAHWPADSRQQFRLDYLAEVRQKLAQNPDYQHVKLTELGRNKYEIAPPNSADVVLTFRNLHNWYMGEYLDETIQASYDALKPGGILGIVEHRAPEGVDENYLKTSGYMTVSKITQIAESVGFVLSASTEINANPKDTKFHPQGVWSLPPSLRAGDKERYKKIGESDRMTLRFVKPL